MGKVISSELITHSLLLAQIQIHIRIIKRQVHVSLSQDGQAKTDGQSFIGRER